MTTVTDFATGFGDALANTITVSRDAVTLSGLALSRHVEAVIDLCAAMAAQRHCRMPVVTASIASASQELTNLSVELQTVVSRFRLG